MSKDDFDLFRHIKKDQRSSSATGLFGGLEDRQYGHFTRNIKAKEHVELYAEEELVRKREYDEMRCEMPGSPRSTFLMVFSADGTKVASTHGNHNIYVTDIRTGKNIKTLVGHPRTPWCIAFHPTSNQIVASGCLGGEVRIWDLSGGSEMWSAGGSSVIASIAFHPNDRVLVIATFNEVYFWDWSSPEPFVHAATSNPKEKVRYVAFDKLGHKLITGIANSPQTRWERVRAPVPVPRQAERCASPYRRRITPRLVNTYPIQPSVPTTADANPNRESSSGVPDRERRITMCYRNLVREYEQLVQRYLQLYRPPTMIDRGTDPMEPNLTGSMSSGTQTPEPSTSGLTTTIPQTGTPVGPSAHPNSSFNSSQPSTSTSQELLTPSRIFSVIKKPDTLIRGTQTSESRKHKADESDTEDESGRQEKRHKKDSKSSSKGGETKEEVGLTNAGTSNRMESTVPSISTQQSEIGIQTQHPKKVLVINNNPSLNEPSTSGLQTSVVDDRDVATSSTNASCCSSNSSNRSGTGNQSNVDELLSNIRRTAEEEVRSRILPIIRSVPANDRPELIRLFEHSREHVRMRFRHMCPLFVKKPNHRQPLESSSEGNSSDDDGGERASRTNRHIHPTTGSNQRASISNTTTRHDEGGSSRTHPPPSISSSSTVRNFNTELEQLVTTLLTEIERSETETNTSSVTSTCTTQMNQDPVSTAARNAVSSPSATPSTSATSSNVNRSTTSPITSTLFSELLDYNLEQRDNSTIVTTNNSSTIGSSTSTTSSPTTYMNTNTGTTNSTIYTSGNAHRRRFFSHRVSAFMPTRVNYTRVPTRLRRNTHIWGRSRLGARLHYGTQSFPLDELINYSERANSEDDPPPQNPYFQPFESQPDFPSMNQESIGIGNMYSNIVQDLESSLNDVRNIRASNRPGETSDILSSFSERLENIMNQSDTILRNLRSWMEMLSTTAEPHNSNRVTPNYTEPSWSFYDHNFYVRDQRTGESHESTSANSSVNLFDLFNSRPPLSAVASDHTYPRNPESPSTSNPENMSPLMTSLHLTISHIQRQARLLRQQVESIERIDRAMIEVAQLQLIRQVNIELLRHIRSFTGSGSSRTTGMTSVRQMMAGTRISDCSPYDSPAEEPNSQPSTSRTEPSSNMTSGESSSNLGQTRPRTSNRKTYPPSRLFRLSRQNRRPSIVHFFSRRYNRSDRGREQRQPSGTQPRTCGNRIVQDLRNQTLLSFSVINTHTVSAMTRRLVRMLSEQMRPYTRPLDTPPPCGRSSATIDLGEHIIALRLHGCVLRMNRILGNYESSTLRNVRADPTAAVTQDGVSRIAPRHTLSLIMDGMSRYIDELGSTGNIPQTIGVQIHSLLALSLLLCELLLLQVVDSIPPSSGGVNLDPERESLTNRIDHMCGQMLQSRFSGHSHQLTRSLRLMRLTMRHAYAALGQTYNARRNAMLPHPNTDRRQLFGSINRCLRTMSRRRPGETSTRPLGPLADYVSDMFPSSSNANPNSSTDNTEPNMRELDSTINDLITRYSSALTEEDQVGNNLPQTSARTDGSRRIDNNSSNNSDDNDDEEPEWQNNSSNRNRNLYRTNNVTLAPNNESISLPRPWNVPSVQINDVPVSEPSLFAHRRQRFVDRMSELRSLPNVGLFRPRFLHPLYTSVNPFDADLDDPQREQIYDSDMITTVTPNHRIQAWDISNWSVPAISNSLQNVVVGECKIHNDASVDVARDGTILVTLLPSGGYLNVTNRLGVYSLRWETLGQCLYTTNFDQNAVSVSLSPLSRHLVVGLASRRVSIVPNDRWIMARIFKIEQKEEPRDRLPVLKELEQSRDSRINCIRWLPNSGQGLIYATNTGQLVILS